MEAVTTTTAVEPEPALSTSEAAPEACEGELRPMLQVDGFVWPRVCQRLGSAADEELERLVEGVLAMANRGFRVQGFCGYRRGEGATTLLLCVAQRLAQRGLNVAVVDADPTEAHLGQRLGLLPETGWQDVVAGQAPVAEALIESLADRLRVLPACEPLLEDDHGEEGRQRAAEALATLGAQHDLVFVDVGPLIDREAAVGPLDRGLGCPLDGLVLVHDIRSTSKESLRQVCDDLCAGGMPVLGIAENFARV